jgi:hypothetical protein
MAKKSPLVEGLLAQGATALDSEPDIQLVSESDLARLAADEAFMHEDIDIIVLPTTDINAAPYVAVTVGSDRVFVPRNKRTRIKRKHLEVLARMRETRITQDLTPNQQGEITMASLQTHTGLAYPFTVLADRNPAGGAWLANILAEPSY